MQHWTQKGVCGFILLFISFSFLTALKGFAGTWCIENPRHPPCRGAPGRCTRNLNFTKRGFVANTAQVDQFLGLNIPFIAKFAQICDQAQVRGNAKIDGHAKISDNAHISEEAQVGDFAQVYNNARVRNNAQIFGRAEVYGQALVLGNARISGHQSVSGDACISDNT